ncbi:tetratricopeptide repeat protein [Shewanella schlegeliana]|uniref:Tetratricopeptide repeat protein n=1 Tax=Shewanella schlegeliana TaxID=190308 RepID=A0ABS1SZS8_9GAMM|nr:tetratricopeptide repeat protein [Shewanella schlegeliana]MBL4913840.1 tetratricopeptide repeat protein [Shewanella schlegeliana]MCL1108776.1 tetratricopeptide repeat protein [Shewanella schlegeliana]
MSIRLIPFNTKGLKFYCWGLVKASAMLGILLFVTACSSTPEEAPVEVKEPERQDLLDVGTLSSVASDFSAPKTEADALTKARTEEQSGNLEKALYAYIQALDFNAKNAETFYQIGRIHTMRGNIDIAFRAYNEALSLDPNLMRVHADLGVISMDKRQYREARLYLEKAIELDQYRLEQLENKQVMREFLVPDQDSPARVYNAIAILEDVENNHQQAREYFKLILELQPHSPVLITNLGYSYYLTGELSMAEKYLRQAIRQDSNFDRAWTNLGLVYVRKGLYKRALATFERTMSPAEALNDLGYFLMLEGQYEKAIALFERAIDTSPSYFEQAQKNLRRAKAEISDEFQHAGY